VGDWILAVKAFSRQDQAPHYVEAVGWERDRLGRMWRSVSLFNPWSHLHSKKLFGAFATVRMVPPPTGGDVARAMGAYHAGDL
jgi:hypothetical protein